MSGIVVLGAGVCGLATAMMLAADGHRVTVLERDPAPPPAPADAWDSWERRGVGQFRLPHFLLPAFRKLLEQELPRVVDALVDGGAARLNLLGPFAEALDPDGIHDTITGRRPLIESAVAAAAGQTPGVDIRRGVAVAGVVTDGSRIPRVLGVRTEAGEEVRGDLVVDAGGRRSPMARWLVEAGARPPLLEEEDSGMVYYGRHVRPADGVFLGGPGLAVAGSAGLLVLPADAGISGIGVIAASDDAELRVLRHEAPWRAAVALLPGGEAVLDSTFVSPLVAMASIEDRWRRFVVDGDPVAFGVVSVGDAWAATNPTLGRGISLAARHGRALRDVVREVGLDAERVVRRFDDVTEADFTPWYRSTVWHDRHRLRELRQPRSAEPLPGSDDPLWVEFRRFQAAAPTDPTVLLPRLFDTVDLRQRPEEVLRDPTVSARIEELGVEVPAADDGDREALLAAISSAC